MHSRWLALGLLLLATAAQAVPAIQHWTTDNGARVFFVPARDLPIVDVRIVFDAASARDGSLPGVAKLTNALLEEGAGDLDADRIADRLADLAAELDTRSQRDMASVSLRVLSDPATLESAVALLALMVGRPTFPPDALERVRGQLLVALGRELQSPSDLAERAFYAEIYGEHPYASPPTGIEQSLKLIRRSDVAAFHARYYVASNAVVAIVGDLDREAAERIAAAAVAKLSRGEPAAPIPAAPAPVVNGARTVPYPSAQTHILMGQPGMSRLDAEYYALYVANHVLGGSGMVSMLTEAIREKQGLAYSVYSYFAPMRAQGPFILGLQTQNANARKSLSLLRRLLGSYLKEGPSDEQLAVAKQDIIGGFPLRIDSNKKILRYLAMIGYYGLPLDYLARFTERIDAVTREQVQSAFARRIRPQHMRTVLVGPGDMTGGLAHAPPHPPVASASPAAEREKP